MASLTKGLPENNGIDWAVSARRSTFNRPPYFLADPKLRAKGLPDPKVVVSARRCVFGLRIGARSDERKLLEVKPTVMKASERCQTAEDRYRG